MATGDPREIQDKGKKASTGAQHSGREADAVRVRTADGWDSGSEDGGSTGPGRQDEKSDSKG